MPSVPDGRKALLGRELMKEALMTSGSVEIMELYPAGLLPENRFSSQLEGAGYATYDEPSLEQQPRKRRIGCSQQAREAALVLPPPSKPVQVSEPALPEDDMELLERIMRECKISDEMDAGGPPPSQSLTPQPSTASTSSSASPAQDAGVAPSTVDKWAEVMVRQLQGCSSVEEAVPQCRELLAGVVQQQLQVHQRGDPKDAQRLRTLQSANSALLRGFRNSYYRQRDMAAKQQQMEDENRRLREELLRSQEALKGSERAKEALKCHLQLMKCGPGPGAGDMPAPGI